MREELTNGKESIAQNNQDDTKSELKACKQRQQKGLHLRQEILI
jgi:hypothetical protein